MKLTRRVNPSTRPRRRPATALLLALLVLAAPRCAEAPPGDALSVMSFNLRYGTADDGENSWAYRRELVFDVIRDAAPDLLGVQEALAFQLTELGEALPQYARVGVGRDDGGSAGEFSAILYLEERFRVAEQGTFWFSDTPEVAGSLGWGARLPRICTWARLVERKTGRALYVYNVHLDHQSQESRQRSVELLVARIMDRETPDPVVVTGDFNAGEGNPALLYLKGADDPKAGVRLRDSYRAIHPDADDVGTFNGFEGLTDGEKIDAVLVTPDWTVDSAAIVRTSRSKRYPSDHFPVTAVLRFPDAR